MPPVLPLHPVLIDAGFPEHDVAVPSVERSAAALRLPAPREPAEATDVQDPAPILVARLVGIGRPSRKQIREPPRWESWVQPRSVRHPRLALAGAAGYRGAGRFRAPPMLMDPALQHWLTFESSTALSAVPATPGTCSPPGLTNDNGCDAPKDTLVVESTEVVKRLERRSSSVDLTPHCDGVTPATKWSSSQDGGTSERCLRSKRGIYCGPPHISSDACGAVATSFMAATKRRPTCSLGR